MIWLGPHSNTLHHCAASNASWVQMLTLTGLRWLISPGVSIFHFFPAGNLHGCYIILISECVFVKHLFREWGGYITNITILVKSAYLHSINWKFYHFIERFRIARFLITTWHLVYCTKYRAIKSFKITNILVIGSRIHRNRTVLPNTLSREIFGLG